MVRVPRDESKSFEISVPPLEIVTVTEALEEGRAIMITLDAIYHASCK